MKQKRLTAEQYKERYCKEKCMRTRSQLYVASDIHEAVMELAHLFRGAHVTAVSLVDAILREHFETHKEMIEGERKRNHEKLKSFLGVEEER
ncbi:MAG: DUF3408 domain-containing protein [Rikenellaceae bacterium]